MISSPPFTTQNKPHHKQPRKPGVLSRLRRGKTLVTAGHVTPQKIGCPRGEGKVSYYMLPLPHFTLRSQRASVLYRSTFRITYSSKYLLNFISVCSRIKNMLNRFLYQLQAIKMSNHMLYCSYVLSGHTLSPPQSLLKYLQITYMKFPE